MYDMKRQVYCVFWYHIVIAVDKHLNKPFSNECINCWVLLYGPSVSKEHKFQSRKLTKYIL